MIIKHILGLFKPDKGKILVDESKLLSPGDILHEAGHLAMLPPHLRNQVTGNANLPDINPEALEGHTIAWSYAAIVHLGLSPEVIFHPTGYRGNSKGLLFNFSLGAYLGVGGLETAGMTVSPKNATPGGAPPYPHMLKWLRG